MVAYQPGNAAKMAAPRHDEPDLVAVPQRPDRADGRAPPGIVAAHDAVQHADTEVEALQDEEARPQDGDGDEPEVGKCHEPTSVDEDRIGVLRLVLRRTAGGSVLRA